MFDEEFNAYSAKRNLNRQAPEVLAFIAQAFNGGVFTDEEEIEEFIHLLSAICYGAVRGEVDKDTGEVLWELTDWARGKVDEAAEEALPENVVRGPW